MVLGYSMLSWNYYHEILLTLIERNIVEVEVGE